MNTQETFNRIMHIFLDANILFSASADASTTRLLLDAALKYAD